MQTHLWRWLPLQRWALGSIALCALSLAGCGSPQSASTRPPAGSHPVDYLVPTTGCGTLPPVNPGTSVSETLVSDGITRTYLLHLPAGYQSDRRQPLVIFLHGASRPSPTLLSDGEQMTGLSSLSDHVDLIAVYPEGTASSAQHIRWDIGSPDDPNTDDVLFVSDLLNHLQAVLCVDEQRIYVTGFSNGGGMAGVLACALAGRIAAFAPVSGSFYSPLLIAGGCHPTRPVPILDIHGTADEKVAYAGDPTQGFPPIQQWLQDWATRDGCQQGPTTFLTQPQVRAEQWSGCQGNATVIHYRIIGGRHLWPTVVLPSTTVIWQFFQSHPLP
jgi:polyhydroxybutyrate depolymerase